MVNKMVEYCEGAAYAAAVKLADSAENLLSHIQFKEWEDSENDIAKITKDIGNVLESIQLCENPKEKEEEYISNTPGFIYRRRYPLAYMYPSE